MSPLTYPNDKKRSFAGAEATDTLDTAAISLHEEPDVRVQPEQLISPIPSSANVVAAFGPRDGATVVGTRVYLDAHFHDAFYALNDAQHFMPRNDATHLQTRLSSQH